MQERAFLVISGDINGNKPSMIKMNDKTYNIMSDESIISYLEDQ